MDATILRTLNLSDPLKSRLLQISLILMLSACGGSASGSENVIANDDPLPTLPPANADVLTRLLETRYDNAQSYDYWQCGNGTSTAYLLLPEEGVLAAGVQQGLEVSGPGFDESLTLVWEVTSANSFMTSYPDFGLIFDYTGLAFTDTNLVKMNSNILGELECTRNSFGAASAPSVSNESTSPSSSGNDSPINNDIEGLVAMVGFFVRRLLSSGFVGRTADAVFTFDDGTYTEDIAGVVADGIAASRANNPEDWGMWRGTADTLELKEWDEPDFEEARDSFLIIPGSSDQRLDRCYSKIGGVGSLFPNGVGAVTTSTFCFFDNGRFTSDSAVWNQGPSYDATFVDPRTQGQYRINGLFAEFIYDDGSTGRTAFGFTERNVVSQIWLNSTVYID